MDGNLVLPVDRLDTEYYTVSYRLVNYCWFQTAMLSPRAFDATLSGFINIEGGLAWP